MNKTLNDLISNTCLSPIGTLLPLNVGGVDLYESPDNSIWLKTGTVEDNYQIYPDAATQLNGDDPYAGISIEMVDTDSGLPIYVRVK